MKVTIKTVDPFRRLGEFEFKEPPQSGDEIILDGKIYIVRNRQWEQGMFSERFYLTLYLALDRQLSPPPEKNKRTS